MTRHSGPFSRLRGFLRDTSGAAAVEMALCFPILGYVGLSVMDFGMYAFAQMQTETAAQMAVSAARSLCNAPGLLPATGSGAKCGSSVTTTMTAAAQDTTLGTSVSIGTPAEGYYCANSSGTLVSVAAITATPPATCATVVSGSTAAPGDYISVTASHAFSPFAPGVSIASLLPGTITQTAWLRLQ